MKYLSAIFAALIFVVGGPSSAWSANYFAWENTPLPAPPVGIGDQDLVFLGGQKGAWILAAKREKPDGSSHASEIYEKLLVIEEDEKGFAWIEEPGLSFSLPLECRLVLPMEKGFLCLDGQTPSGASLSASIITYKPEDNSFAIEKLPPLTGETQSVIGTSMGEKIFVLTKSPPRVSHDKASTLYSLDLSERDKPDFAWRELGSSEMNPGPEAVMAARETNHQNKVLLFKAGPEASSVSIFDFEDPGWKPLEDVRLPDDFPTGAPVGRGFPSGPYHLLFLNLEGKGDALLAFNVVTNAWSTSDAPPPEIEAASIILPLDAGNFLTFEPGRGGPRDAVWKMSPLSRSGFGAANYAVLGVYLIVLLGMGVYFARREKSTDDFFKAGGRVPWWAAGMSIFGTGLSVITFISLPAMTFASDLTYMPMSFAQFLAIPVVVAFYIPVFRRLKITTSYEYLETRFNLPSRIIGSAAFVTFQLARFAIVLYIPAFTLSLVTGISEVGCILIIGAIAIVYTVMGGIEAVIWTDVLQVIALLGGAFLCFFLIIMKLDGGAMELAQVAWRDGKLHMIDSRLSLAPPTLLVTVLGGFAYTMINAGSDQTYVQRYQTTAGEKDAARSLWTFGVLTIPAAFVFYGMGTALYVFFKDRPEALSPANQNFDAVFPWYIMTQLPAGAAGLIVAGLFAAAMSSLDSAMNSVAAVATTDYYRRFKKDASEAKALRFAKIATAAVGIVGTAVALLMAASSERIGSLLNEFQKWIGLLAGGLGGLFLLGLLSKRANGPGAIAGLIGSGLIQYAVQEYLPVHLLFYTFTGFLSCVIIGYAASLMTSRPPKAEYSYFGVKGKIERE